MTSERDTSTWIISLSNTFLCNCEYVIKLFCEEASLLCSYTFLGVKELFVDKSSVFRKQNVKNLRHIWVNSDLLKYCRSPIPTWVRGKLWHLTPTNHPQIPNLKLSGRDALGGAEVIFPDPQPLDRGRVIARGCFLGTFDSKSTIWVSSG